MTYNTIIQLKENYDKQNIFYINSINKYAFLIINSDSKYNKDYNSLLHTYFDLRKKYREFQIEYNEILHLFIEKNNSIKLSLN